MLAVGDVKIWRYKARKENAGASQHVKQGDAATCAAKWCLSFVVHVRNRVRSTRVKPHKLDARVLHSTRADPHDLNTYVL